MKVIKINNKKKLIVILIVIGVILIGAVTTYFCFFGGSNKKGKSKSKQNVVENVVKEEKKLQIVDLDSNSRNIAVMINNISTVWGYQAGIQDAYLVYEMITEGGITRMMAIFKDKATSRIASIRSSRHYFLDYVLENDAIYIHVGGSDRALGDIKSLGINNINADTCTWDSKIPLSREHTAYTTIDAIKKGINNYNYRDTTKTDLLLDYSIEEISLENMDEVLSANTITIPYSNSHTTKFVYDNTLKVYKRFQNNTEHKDYITGNQYTAKNIITYQVSNHSFDSYGRQDLNNVGNGKGYYITNGYAVPITWEKTSRSSQTIYKYLNGKEIIVNDGNTFIEIEPSIENLTIS